MNNTFSPNRFVKFFVFDIKNAFAKFGLTAVVLALVPVITLIIYQMFALLITGTLDLGGDGMNIATVFAAYVACAILALVAPVKIYGNLTDRRFGSEYILTPASTFEKWLSMMLVCMVVLPLVSALSFLLVDTLMALVMPSVYGQSIISLLNDLNSLVAEDISIEMADHFGVGTLLGYMLSGWVLYILIFTIGALVFKKSKIAKTILAIFVVSMVLSNLMMIVWNIFDPGLQNFIYNLENDVDPLGTFASLMDISTISIIVQFIVYMGIIYYRLRTIKH